MQVECAERRHLPNNSRKHPERYYYEKVGMQGAQLLYKRFIAELYRLHHLESVLYGEKFYRRLKHPVAPSGRFVGHRYDADNIVASVD